MGKIIRQYVADAFTDRVFSGNPAAVCVLDEWLPDGVMQDMALENNLSETAFTVREGDTVTLYIADTAPLYEWQGVHRLHAYLAMVPGGQDAAR